MGRYALVDGPRTRCARAPNRILREKKKGWEEESVVEVKKPNFARSSPPPSARLYFFECENVLRALKMNERTSLRLPERRNPMSLARCFRRATCSRSIPSAVLTLRKP